MGELSLAIRPTKADKVHPLRTGFVKREPVGSTTVGAVRQHPNAENTRRCSCWSEFVEILIKQGALAVFDIIDGRGSCLGTEQTTSVGGVAGSILDEGDCKP